MILKKIRLTNFRSYDDLKLNLSPLTVFVGPNGVGKTNILEAVAMLSTSRSHRTTHDRETVMWDKDTARLEGDMETSHGPLKLAIAITNQPNFAKTYFINGAVRRATELLGLLESVVFSPESLDLIYGPPHLRRRFLDILLCQTDPQYTRILWQYHQIVRQRNQLLISLAQNLASPDELDFWDNQLIELGSVIITSRQAVADFINQHLATLYQSVSGQPDVVHLHYRSNCTPATFRESLDHHRDREIRFGATLIGPHRDELIFTLNHHPLAAHGSRGEVRSAILALKMTEVAYHKTKSESYPLLLLDDIFSELDNDRRDRLAEIVASQQTLITTTDLDHLAPSLRQKADIIKLPIKLKE